jgi:hypothetical protein
LQKYAGAADGGAGGGGALGADSAHFCKVLQIVNLYGVCTRALIFQNFWAGGASGARLPPPPHPCARPRAHPLARSHDRAGCGGTYSATTAQASLCARGEPSSNVCARSSQQSVLVLLKKSVLNSPCSKVRVTPHVLCTSRETHVSPETHIYIHTYASFYNTQAYLVRCEAVGARATALLMSGADGSRAPRAFLAYVSCEAERAPELASSLRVLLRPARTQVVCVCMLFVCVCVCYV